MRMIDVPDAERLVRKRNEIGEQRSKIERALTNNNPADMRPVYLEQDGRISVDRMLTDLDMLADVRRAVSANLKKRIDAIDADLAKLGVTE